MLGARASAPASASTAPAALRAGTRILEPINHVRGAVLRSRTGVAGPQRGHWDGVTH